MAITDAKITFGLPVGATNIRKSDGTTPTVRYMPVGENLLSNGGFETDVSGWNADGTGAAIARSTSQAKAGSASIEVAKGTSAQTSAKSDAVTVTPGVLYVLSSWSKRGTATTSAFAYIRWFDSGGSTISETQPTNPNTTTSWAFHSISGTAPANAVTARVMLAINGSSAQTGYFDALVLQPCAPVVESPYTEPASTGTFAGGSVEYDLAAKAFHAGDVKVFDMGAQTDGTLSGSSYTRVYDPRHAFTGDLLADNGVVRLWVKRGTAYARVYVYANGSWGSARDFYPDTGGDASAAVSVFQLMSTSPERGIVSAVTSDGNRVAFTMYRGSALIRADTTRVAATQARQDFEMGSHQRFSVVSGSTVARDATVSASSTTVTGSTLTEPYSLMLNPESDPILSGIAFTRKPTQLLHGATSWLTWRDTAATTSAFQRTFWLMALPWPWLTNGSYFKEAESASLSGGAASAADASASGGSVAALDASGEEASYSSNYMDRDFPAGEYTLVVRAKDTNAVTNDLQIGVYNVTDVGWVSNSVKTLTTSFAYYTHDFSLTSSVSGDNLRISAKKITATANTISVDYFLVIPRKRNSSTPSHVFFPYDLAHNALMSTTVRESVRRVG